MFGFLKKKEVFVCPVDGKILPISEVNDPVFSQEMMGPGFAVVPTSKVVVAPMDGDVVKAGDALVEVDFDVLKSEGKDPTCMIIFPNKEKFSIVKPHSNVTTGQDNIIEFNK